MTHYRAAALMLAATVASAVPATADEIRIIGTGAVKHTSVRARSSSFYLRFCL